MTEYDGMLLNLVSESKEKKVKPKIKSDPEELLHTKSPTKQKKVQRAENPQKSAFYGKQEFEPSKPKSAFDNLHGSSLFKSNPEITALSVVKQKGLSEPLFSSKTFEDLDLHPHLLSCLKNRLQIEKMTRVQEKTIPLLLSGRDALVKSCTGSGKTLAYAVPILHQLQGINPKIKREDGVFALVVVPTRELALQCFDCFSSLTYAFKWIVPGYLIGGEKKKSEKARLRKGINILISTPGRLLDHLESTFCLTLEKVKWLVIDEADKLLEQGFEEAVKKIIEKCQLERNTILLSATLSKSVENLAGISLSNPTHVNISAVANNQPSEFEDLVLPSKLKQFITVVPAKLRLTVLSAYIIDKFHKGKLKGLIFMCSQCTVSFHYSLFSSSLAHLLREKGHKCKFFSLHGNMKQEERTAVFNTFKSSEEGILLCTDVAARGLDLPHVDWIVQYSAPPSPEIYVHRVGRTARIGKKGSALLFLLPSENKFSNLLTQHKIVYEEISATNILQSLLLIGELLTNKKKLNSEDCATFLQGRYEKEVYSEEILHQSAKDAFASYVQSYLSYPVNIRDVLPFKALHLGHIAKSFCLREAPSELRSPLSKAGHKFHRKSLDNSSQKRKHQTIVSEFDSGLSSLPQFTAKKAKRKY